MIKYRYNLETDPEPGPHVKRLRGWRPGSILRSCWTRRPCQQKGYLIQRRHMDRAERRWARREGQFWVDRSGRRLHNIGVRRRRGAWSCVRATGGRGHYHWTDGDKSRDWGILRGDTIVVDADAMRRLHTKKRRGWK